VTPKRKDHKTTDPANQDVFTEASDPLWPLDRLPTIGEELFTDKKFIYNFVSGFPPLFNRLWQ